MKSLQNQEFPIQKIVGVVDGNDQPDLDMAYAFVKAFPENRSTVIHLPELPTKIYKAAYQEFYDTLNIQPLSRLQLLRHWVTQAPKAGQEISHQYAWHKTLEVLREQDKRENWAQWDAVCFAQPHGHKRTGKGRRSLILSFTLRALFFSHVHKLSGSGLLSWST